MAFVLTETYRLGGKFWKIYTKFKRPEFLKSRKAALSNPRGIIRGPAQALNAGDSLSQVKLDYSYS